MKKNIPLTLLPELNKLLSTYRHLVIPVSHPGKMLYLKDKDPHSNLYFSVSQRDQDFFFIEKRPTNKYNSEKKEYYAVQEELLSHLFDWLRLLEEYNDATWIFDDPIKKKYADSFFKEFSVIDEDANYSPFDIPRMLFLETHLQKVIAFINENRNDFTDQKEPERLVMECEVIVENLPNTTKNQVLRNISKVWASISKNSLPMMKKFITNIANEFIKEIAKTGAGSLTDIIKTLGESL